MKQENQVTHSTTNTAALELLELIGQYWDLAHAEGLEGRMTDTEAGDAQRCRHEIESRITTLTQQQGGEQEARYFASGPEGHFYADNQAFAEAIIRKSLHADDGTITDIAELRTKQPAASEGDVARAAQHVKNIATMPIGWFTDDHLTDRSATTYDKTVADRWVAKGWPITPIYTTPPRHPADEGRDATCGHCRGTGEVPHLVQHASGDPQDAYEGPSDCPSCGGTGAVTAVSSEQCVALYDAVMRSGMTRDVKTPERKTEIVRAALQAGTP